MKKIISLLENFAINILKKIFIPKTKRINLYEFITNFYKNIQLNGISQRANAISFNLIMALPAALLFFLTLIPYFPESFKIKKEFLYVLKDISPNSSTYKFLADMINGLYKKQIGIFSSGFLLIIYYTSNAMMGIISCFDISIQEEKKYYLYPRLRALKVTFILFLLFLVSLSVLFLKDQLFIWLTNLLHFKLFKSIRLYLHWSIIILSLFYFISFIYKYAPNIKKRWTLKSWGSFIATIFNLSTIYAFYFWVNNYASYNQVYGAIGTVLILLFLIYLNSFILLIGFEINVCIHNLEKEKET